MMGYVILILGLALWYAGHLFKRLAPEARAKLGPKGRGPITLVLLGGVILMVIGYRMADGAFLWGRHPATVGINNLLMVASVYLFAVSGAKTALARKMRHPMLGAVKLWALAHLLVNGDAPSLILFGGLLVWAVIEVILINRAEPEWTPPPAKPAYKELVAIGAATIAYAAIVAIHYALGYPTFG